MNWYLLNAEGLYLVRIDQYTSTCMNNPHGPLKAMVFPGTRDYVNGIIYAIQLMGGEPFTPKLIEEKKEVGI